MKGDRGDGIPNFLSDDSCIISKQRQKPLATKKLDLWVDQEPELFCDERMLRNYRRNEQLVDLEMVPQDIATDIMQQYLSYDVPKRSGLLNYFIKNKLRNLMDNLQEF